jgi:hypothetical protein
LQGSHLAVGKHGAAGERAFPVREVAMELLYVLLCSVGLSCSITGECLIYRFVQSVSPVALLVNALYTALFSRSAL